MNIKCEKCGKLYDINSSYCPNCGAENSYMKDNSNTSSSNTKITNPKTIDELRQWYTEQNLPSENVTRFFIGKNYTGAKAFGIYKDDSTGKFIVYKNKADGSRAVRYQGTDEQYAVNELFSRLKEEILNQKANNQRKLDEYYGSSSKSGRKNGMYISFIAIWLLMVFLPGIILLISIVYMMFQPQRGYYIYANDYYYYQSGSWYEYDENNGWYRTTVSDNLKKKHSTYYRASRNIYDIDSFEDSSYYVEPSTYSSSSSSSSSSSDYSWSSDSSWDSGSTDWDSDW